MDINYKILKNLLECNKSIKLVLNDNILDIFSNNKLYTTIKLNTHSIEYNSEVIYNHIINLDGINLYIPKIYYKDE